DGSDAVLASAKQGIGTEDILERIVTRIPPPRGSRDAPLQALIFDSWFDPYHGAVVLIRVVNGVVRKGDRIRLMAAERDYEITRLGGLTPGERDVESLGPGEVGVLAASIKEIAHAKIGDTVTHAQRPAASPFPGFKAVKAMVFAGLYPADTGQY